MIEKKSEKSVGPKIKKRTHQDIIDFIKKNSPFPGDPISPFIEEFVYGLPDNILNPS